MAVLFFIPCVAFVVVILAVAFATQEPTIERLSLSFVIGSLAIGGTFFGFGLYLVVLIVLSFVA